MLRSLFNFFFGLYFKWLFRRQVNLHADRSIYFFDIDNTIGNTYPTLMRTYSNERERILSVKAFPRMKVLVSALQQSKSRKVIFLTSRSYLLWNVTATWLNRNGMNADKTDVILVKSPAEKIELLQSAAQTHRRLVYIDDLSYNHEHGEVKFYDAETAAAGKLPLRYIGYKTILRFNSGS